MTLTGKYHFDGLVQDCSNSSANWSYRSLALSHRFHDDVIKWKQVPRYWPFVLRIHRHGEFPAQRPVTRSFDVYFDLCLNKRLSKQSWGWWFETPSCSLWRHHNVCSRSPLLSLHRSTVRLPHKTPPAMTPLNVVPTWSCSGRLASSWGSSPSAGVLT